MTFNIDLNTNSENSLQSLTHHLGNYFEATIKFLNEFKWIYDFQTTELFTSKLFTHHFKQEWIDYFKRLDIDQLKQVFTDNQTSNDTPETLKSFLDQSRKLLSMQTLLDKTISLKKQRQTKKQHEIEQMVPFVRDLCLKHKCKYIIDVGSGLGYFGRLLSDACPDLTIIAVEKNEDFQNEASKRNSNKKIINMSHTIDKNSSFNLISQIRKLLNEPDDKELNMGLISLHSCGDLTPNMINIFTKNKDEFKFMAAFSCCYQSMQPVNESNLHSTKNEFHNFPMSKSLKKFQFNLSLFALRLACQPSISTWLMKSDLEHDEHMKQVAYRGVLQKYCSDNNLTMTKLKRKLAGLNEFSTFKSYVDYLRERVEFNHDDKSSSNKKELDLMNLNQCYSNLEVYFELIKPLTALQSMMQPILEMFLLNDRLAYLFENNLLNSKLVKLFDSSISPRCICILSERDI